MLNERSNGKPTQINYTDLAKINSLISAFLATIHNQLPEIKNIRYDLSTGQFTNKNNLPVHRKGLLRFRDSGNGQGAKATRAGQATMRRAILIQTLVSSESGEKSGLLEKFLNGASQLVESGDLRHNPHPHGYTL